MSSHSHRKLQRPLAISYCEKDEFSDAKVVKGPISFNLFEKRYRSKEWPSVNYKTLIWNGTEFKQWTPVYRIDDIFKKLDPKKHRELKQMPQQQQKENNTNTANKKQRKKSKNTWTNIMNDKIKSNVSRWCYCCPLSLVSLELLKWLIISRGTIFLCVFTIRYFLYFHAFDASNLISNDNIHILSHSRLDFYSLKYLASFSNWDGEYFLHIAQFGYEHEKIYAFYPGLPLILNSIILFIQNNPLFALKKIHFKSMALICGITWNGLISSYLSSLILYYLTLKIYNKPSIALISAKLFLINPASIFFVSIYTESTFSFCSFLLMLCCELKYFDYNLQCKHSVILTMSILLCIIIASSLRSNGILMVGFPIFYHIYTNFFISNNIINALSLLNTNYIHNICNINIQIKLFVKNIASFLWLIATLSLALTPWIYYNFVYSKNTLCGAAAESTESRLASRAYCQHLYATVYGFVQGRYWQCGFLKRWNSNEIGNFLLAAPIWFISFHAIKYYVRKFILICSFHERDNHLNINMMQVHMNNEHGQKQNGYHSHSHHKNGNGKITIASGLKLLRAMGMIQNANGNGSKSARQLFDNEILLNHKLIPYVVYWFLLWIICVFYAHVQISTRFICCSCPPLYWFCAQIILSYNKNEKQNKKKNNKFVDVLCKKMSQKPSPKLIVSYFLLYFTIGTIAFSAYLPFV